VILRQPALFDAGPLIHLAELGLLDLLNLFKKRYTTKQVLFEVEVHYHAGITEKHVDLCVGVDSTPQIVYDIAKIFSLDAGEISVLSCILLFHPNAIFVSDDSAARLSSDTLKIESVGTLGIIIKGGTLGLIPKPEALDALRSIPNRTSLFIKKELLSEIIQKTHNAWRL